MTEIAENKAILVDNPFMAGEDKIEREIPTGTLQMYEFIAEYLARPATDTNINRASSATYCPRRRWYQKNGYQSTPLTPRKIINFLIGDIIERVTCFFVSQGCVGPGKLYSEVYFGDEVGEIHFQNKPLKIYKQPEMTAVIGGIPVTCHPDGRGRRNTDGRWEGIEIKSAAPYGFKSFKEVGPEAYLKQAHTQMEADAWRALEIREVRFWYVQKVIGTPWDALWPYDPKIAEQVKTELIEANGKEIPDRAHQKIDEMVGQGRGKPKKKSGRKTVPWQCQYCGFLEVCHGAYTVEFTQDWASGTSKPGYFFNQKEN